MFKKMGAALSATNYGDKLGVAAPQIGISKRLMVVMGAVMINPTWQPSRAPKETIVEGCYSVPGKVYEVERAPYGWATWKNIEGTERRFKLNGLNAIVFQHELDHLDGRCCADVGKLLKEDNTTKMAKYKILEDVVINGISYKAGAITDLDYQRANLTSLKGKLEKVDPNAKPAPEIKNAEQTPAKKEAPADTGAVGSTSAPETPVAAPAPAEPAPAAPVEPEKAPEVPAEPEAPKVRKAKPADQEDPNGPPMDTPIV